jgi:hypothetical protein
MNDQFQYQPTFADDLRFARIGQFWHQSGRFVSAPVGAAYDMFRARELRKQGLISERIPWHRAQEEASLVAIANSPGARALGQIWQQSMGQPIPEVTRIFTPQFEQAVMFYEAKDDYERRHQIGEHFKGVQG